MNSDIYIPYSYVLFHIPTKKRYYGIQYGKNANPSNLWTTYFTSSKIVHNLIEKYGKESFLFEVRKTFLNKTEALLWEHKFLKKIDAKNNNMWLNQHNGNGNFLNFGGYKQNNSTIRKKSGNNHYTVRLGYSPQKGKVFRTNEQKNKYSESKKGRLNPRASSCKLYDKDGNLMKFFDTKQEAYDFFLSNHMPLSLLNYQRYEPTKFNKQNTKYKNFVGCILIQESFMVSFS